MSKTLRVGIIGASAEGGWARDGHVPAVQGLEGFAFVAVATNSRKTADAAAKAFGVRAAFASGLELVRDAEADIVTVATRVPDHRELVLAAISAGKHVYCEWPLGCTIAEAQEMAVAAERAGVHTAIGLQLRGSPVAREAAALLNAGKIGRILSVGTTSSTVGFGPDVPEAYAYLEDPANFANLVTIQGAHTLDLAIAVVGGLADVSALATAQYPEISTDGVPKKRVTADHLLLQSRLSQSGTLAVEVAGGRPPETPFLMEIVGEKGVLQVHGGAARGVQAGRLTLSIDGEQMEVDQGEFTSMPDAAANVAGVYAALRNDIRDGTSTVCDFEHAVRLTRLMTDIFGSSDDGVRKIHSDWPTH